MRWNRLLHILIFSSILKVIGCRDKGSDDKVIDSAPVMKEFRNNIETNRKLTKQTLDTSSDERLEDKIIANIDSKLNPELGNDKDVLPTLSKARQAIYYIYQVEVEVNDGGFDQFYLNNFVNSDRSYMFNRTTDAFKLIGATRFAALIEKANQVFKANEKDFAEKEGLFDELDQEFYDSYKQENLSDLRIKFIKNNIEAFVDK
jgi:hypothetical protein